MGNLPDLAAIATIVTLAIAVVGLLWPALARYRIKRKLEKYLRNEKIGGKDLGRRTMNHLVAKLRLTEEQIINAAGKSKHIHCPIIKDRKTGNAAGNFFEYKD
ncbi:hypothetical protein [Brucella pituitosa]|uniref:hypothetical protein n=1 Tax=Brucella pituitosa TaxID=571256 RepID=UPI000C280B44|nr:hypothetical protein [Brucella pituitosa]PJO48906.1 hypothetical protein CWE02_03680 [Brucella pituitosa]